MYNDFSQMKQKIRKKKKKLIVAQFIIPLQLASANKEFLKIGMKQGIALCCTTSITLFAHS